MSKQNETCKNELWDGIPEELLKEVIIELPQDQVLAVTGVRVPGFRVGKIPAQILAKAVYREYEKNRLARERLQRAVYPNLKEIAKRLKKISVRRLPDELPQLVEEYCKTKAFLTVLLDERKGIRKTGRQLWENLSAVKQEAVDGEKFIAVNENEEAVTGTDTAAAAAEVTGPVRKLQRSLQKAEKKLCETRQQHRKIVSERDRKIRQQQAQIEDLISRVTEKEQSIDRFNDELLNSKKQISRLKDSLSAALGRLRQAEQELTAQKKEYDSKECDSLEAVTEEITMCDEEIITGEFVYQAPDGWVVSDQGAVVVAGELISKLALVTGDVVELKIAPADPDRETELAVVKKTESIELTGHIIFADGDYWVECGTGKVYVGAEEVFRAGADAGDPVSVRVPAHNETAGGYITRLHWVSIINEIRKTPVSGQSVTSKPAGGQKKIVKPADNTMLAQAKVLVIGGDSVKAGYIRELERLGAQVEWHTGFNELPALAGKVRRADVVLVVTSHMSHKAYYIVKNQVKAMNKQIVYYNGQGIRGAAFAVAAVRNHRKIDTGAQRPDREDTGQVLGF